MSKYDPHEEWREMLITTTAQLRRAEAENAALRAVFERTALYRTVGQVLVNAENHPVPASVIGRDLTKLINVVIDAVIAAGGKAIRP